ncbi:antibiotic biosynthesis monooxygenase family protein [Actinokineospora sp. G85]|uniref:antibiotic biosynthesis monooxygenase family protein n=1 Tax=Actinokineospora sp. G85 TaxID=3406626 RepID=UPI003C712002
MLLIARFTVGDAEGFAERAERAVGLLAAQPGCRRGLVVRSTEDSGGWVVTVEFESVAAYRRSMSPFDVRAEVIPFLAEADSTESGAFEVVVEASGGEVVRHVSLVAADAGTVRLGEASGPATAR